jgi:polyisoprenyl-teichoic acid--peptidoglycan teichoic acid transferase
MPEEEKPYRVYRGGRTKGRVPIATPRAPRDTPHDGVEAPRRTREERRQRPKRSWRDHNWKRIILVTVGLIVILMIAWAVTSYLAFRSGVRAADKRLDKRTRAALVHQNGLLLSHPTNILLLGTDHAAKGGRAGLRHSDSIMLLRTDPKHHRLVYLSILRDLRVDIPGYGLQKINAAYQFGGPRLAVKTVRAVTGMPINHIVIVDFANFRELIDKLGGVDIDVPAPILSNRFDCPFKTAAQCARWKGWRFAKGTQHMNGRRALVYSRIRENQLNRSESDATRAERQQSVIQAVGSKLTGLGTLIKLPFIGDSLLKPATTDLSPWQFLQLGWIKFRAGKALRCRLGGTSYGGYIIPDEEKFATLRMVVGKAAPQPPAPGSPYGSGCLIKG